MTRMTLPSGLPRILSVLIGIPVALSPAAARGDDQAFPPAVVPWRALCAPYAATLDELRRHGEMVRFEAATAEGFRLLVLVAPDGAYSVAVELRAAPPAPHALCLLSVGNGFAPALPGASVPERRS